MSAVSMNKEHLTLIVNETDTKVAEVNPQLTHVDNDNATSDKNSHMKMIVEQNKAKSMNLDKANANAGENSINSKTTEFIKT